MSDGLDLVRFDGIRNLCMRAVITTRAGGPEVLAIGEVPTPQPAGSDLAIDVWATALNRADLLQRRGSYAPPSGVSDILGLECAGVVAAVGPHASPDWLGQRVMCLLAGGGYAERVVVPERMAMPLGELTFEQGAAIPEAFLTASEALFQEGALRPLERVLIHAAASGVGSAAVQLAVQTGARVFATARSAAKCRFVESLGAELACDSTQASFADVLESRLGARPIDVVIDLVGAAHWEQNQRLLAEQGRLVSVGVLGGSEVRLELGQLLRRRQRILGLVMRSRSEDEKIALTQRFLRRGLPALAAGRLRPIVDRVFPMDQVADAHRYMEQNQNIGKIVLRVRD